MSNVEGRIGFWLAAALEDPNVCDEMKADIRAWFGTEPQTSAGSATAGITHCQRCKCELNGEAALMVWCHSCADETALLKMLP